MFAGVLNVIFITGTCRCDLHIALHGTIIKSSQRAFNLTRSHLPLTPGHSQQSSSPPNSPVLPALSSLPSQTMLGFSVSLSLSLLVFPDFTSFTPVLRLTATHTFPFIALHFNHNLWPSSPAAQIPVLSYQSDTYSQIIQIPILQSSTFIFFSHPHSYSSVIYIHILQSSTSIFSCHWDSDSPVIHIPNLPSSKPLFSSNPDSYSPTMQRMNLDYTILSSHLDSDSSTIQIPILPYPPHPLRRVSWEACKTNNATQRRHSDIDTATLPATLGGGGGVLERGRDIGRRGDIKRGGVVG